MSTFNESHWISVFEEISRNASKRCGLVHDIYQRLFSEGVDEAVSTLPDSERELAIALAKEEFDYLTQDEVEEQKQSNLDSNLCSHGLDPDCCPLGCGEF